MGWEVWNVALASPKNGHGVMDMWAHYVWPFNPNPNPAGLQYKDLAQEGHSCMWMKGKPSDTSQVTYHTTLAVDTYWPEIQSAIDSSEVTDITIQQECSVDDWASLFAQVEKIGYTVKYFVVPEGASSWDDPRWGAREGETIVFRWGALCVRSPEVESAYVIGERLSYERESAGEVQTVVLRVRIETGE